MKWTDRESDIVIDPPKEFNFEECLVYLKRSDQELLHQMDEGFIYKLIQVNEALILCKISSDHHSITVEFPMGVPPTHSRKQVAAYIWEWFDLDRDLKEFYQIASQDRVLKTLVQSYYGLRVIGIPDLFEALVWAVMGQQINLTFAYTLKRRFVEQYGESLVFEGKTYWLFPSFERIASLHIDDLRQLQFTMRKAEYTIGIAKAMASGELSRESLLQMKEDQPIRESLMMIRGIGAWTADYVMMKCLRTPSSFPIADVGLHNALKNVLGLERKPTIDEIREYAVNWEGWQAYATFYLWRSLL